MENNPTEQQDSAVEVTAALIERARAGNHSDFALIRNIEEFFQVREYKYATSKVYTQFKKMGNFLYKNYVKALKVGQPDLELLVSARNCRDVSNFYLNELEIIKEIIEEYKLYAFHGHIKEVLMGKERPEHSLIDYRSLPSSWFGEFYGK